MTADDEMVAAYVKRARAAAMRQGKPTASPAQREIVARILAAHLAEKAATSAGTASRRKTGPHKERPPRSKVAVPFPERSFTFDTRKRTAELGQPARRSRPGRVTSCEHGRCPAWAWTSCGAGSMPRPRTSG